MLGFKVISRHWTGKNFLAFVLISILSCIVYANSLDNSFHFDDQHYVSENPYIRRIQNIPAFFRSPRYSSSEKPFTAHYRPLVVTSYAVNYAMGGLEPFGYHLLSLGFHIGSAFLLFLILQTILTLPLPPSHQGRGEKEVVAQFIGQFIGQESRDRPSGMSISPMNGATTISYLFVPLAAALIFAVHPFNSEVVNYITARSSVMCAFFYLLAFYFWVKFREVAGSRQQAVPVYCLLSTVYYIASLLAFLLAMLSKEIAITFPAMLILYDLFFVPLRGKVDYLKRLLSYLPFVFSIMIPYLILRKIFYGHFTSSRLTRGFYGNLYTQTKVIVEYISLFLFPSGLTIDHPVGKARSFFEMEVIFSAVIILGILGFAYYLWRYGGRYGGSWRIVSFSIIWFFVTLLPVTIIPLNALMQENRAYLAGAGLAVITGIGVGILSQKLARTIMGLRPTKGGFSDETLMSLRNTKDNKNVIPFTLNHALNLFHGLVQGLKRCRNKFGMTFKINGLGAFSGKKSNNAVYCLLSTVYLLVPLIIAYSTVTIQRNSVWSDDVTLWSDAVKKAPLSARSYDNLGLAYARAGNREKAEEMFKKTLAINPKYFFTYYNLGVFYQEQENWRDAERYYQRAIRLDPRFYNAYYNLGLVYRNSGRYEEAIEAYKMAISIDPRRPAVYNNMGDVYWKKGDKEEAIRYFQMAVERLPYYFTGYYNLGKAYHSIGEYRKAIDAYRAALKIDPTHRGAKEKLRELMEERAKGG